MVSRYGGDDFAVLIHGADAARRAEDATGRIADCLKNPFQLDQHELFVPATFGIATGEDPDCDAGDLLRRADLARAAAKRRGGDRWVVFDEQLGARVRERHSLERQLQVALARGQMAVAFQPIFSLPGREVLYVESLAR